MKSYRLDRQYAKLAATERFRLVIGAEARADESEIELLLRTCPRFTYHGRDVAFERRFEQSFHFTLTLLGALEVIAGKLAVLAAAEEVGRRLFGMAADNADFEAFRISGTLQPSIRRTVRRERGSFRKIFRGVRETVLIEGATLAHAFAGLCRDELELDASELVTAVSPLQRELFDYFLAARPNLDLVRATQPELAEGWHRWIGEKPRPTHTEDAE